MVYNQVKEITKEDYTKAIKNNGTFTDSQLCSILGQCLVCGYGIYGHSVYTDNNRYYIKYNHGSTCD